MVSDKTKIIELLKLYGPKWNQLEKFKLSGALVMMEVLHIPKINGKTF